MRAALAGLTTRGRSFLAAGIAASLCGLVLGERDLLRVGVLLLALPLVAAGMVARARYRLACSRRIEPPRVPVGEPARVVLRIENLSRLRSSVLLAEDRLPYALGGRPRFVLGRIEPHGVREMAYPVRADVRGRYTVGPLALRFVDVFGLVETVRTFRSTSTLVVTPRVYPLTPLAAGAGRAGSTEGEARSLATSGEDDVTPREYRHGDDLRRVHWRLTARHGELMVRREEQPWHRRAVLLLDRRATAHRGEGVASSLEWAVTAVASVGVRLARDNFRLRLVDSDGAPLLGVTPSLSTEAELLEVLAALAPAPGADFRGAASAIRGSNAGLLVAVLGALSMPDVEVLADLQRHASRCLAIVLDVDRWNPLNTPRTPGLPASRTAALLAASGWRVAVADGRTRVPGVWQQLVAVGLAGAPVTVP
ncbi:protein of unknown function DUF58 [Acidothermus cellulolyticus 11B]|uniref:DUF58 domain-containing protein n=1 Tax=Acidothermus cellulolyticus (strain ATCC 43068 / DSM 8971 / 11B) TaxID=351607 RepID=A0LTL2_ACIC1|nr:DUF58 domain-containing protein [Acidothermus cellulolyticus]ABK52772.1 protein of unknown function DUF58 [Acidothermus cellulolyticus 11B]MBX5447740.1 DUF58 domain-containing protein [Acidothermus cellulolyticus]